MSNQTETTSEDLSRKTEVPMDANTRLSYERTNLSHERTLMSWVRTATSLITFGFTIYKFFELEIGASVPPRTHQIIGPREFSMVMIAIGLLALFLATIQNWQHRTNMRKQHIEAPYSLTTLVAGLISALGLLAMASTIFRW